MRTVHKNWLDRQRIWPAGKCAFCGNELYPGGFRRRAGGLKVCENCAASRPRPRPAPHPGSIGEVER